MNTTQHPLPGMPGIRPRLGLSVIGLILGPRSSVRTFVDRVRCGVEDVAACFSEGDRHDSVHDGFLLNAERLAERGIQISRAQGCPCAARYQSILRDIKSAQAADDAEDHCLYRTGWPIAKRINGYLEQWLKARRTGGGRS